MYIVYHSVIYIVECEYRHMLQGYELKSWCQWPTRTVGFSGKPFDYAPLYGYYWSIPVQQMVCGDKQIIVWTCLDIN